MRVKEIIKSILEDKRKLSIAAIVAIAGALVLTVFVAQKQQEIRQRAAGEQTAFFFSTGTGCTSPVTTTSFSPGATSTLNLCLNTDYTGISLISGFDVTIAKGNGVTFTGISDGVDGARLQTALNRINPDGSLRLAKADYTNTLNGTALNIGQITLTTAATGNGSISVTKADVTSPTTTAALTVAMPALPYTIGATPTPTTTGISTRGPCYPLGDVDVDGDVDAADALLILRYVAALPITGTFNQLNADVDRDGDIDSVDALKIQRYIAGLDTTFSGCGINPPPITPTRAPTVTPVPTAPPLPTPTTTGISTRGPCYPLGDTDVDGDVDAVDALNILKFVAGTPITGTFNQLNADVDRDGDIDSVDALKIQRYIAGLDTTFSGCGINPPPITPTRAPTVTPVPTAPPLPTPTTTGISTRGPCYPLGDVNVDGEVNSVDALRILRYVGDITPAPEGTFNQLNADVDRDGDIDSVDALKIQRYIAGLDTTFSGCGINPPTVAPTIISTPGQNCPLKVHGDANCNGTINIVDFNIWRDEFKKVLNTTTSNFNNSTELDPITILDFNYWREGFKDSSFPHTPDQI